MLVILIGGLPAIDHDLLPLQTSGLRDSRFQNVILHVRTTTRWRVQGVSSAGCLLGTDGGAEAGRWNHQDDSSNPPPARCLVRFCEGIAIMTYRVNANSIAPTIAA